MPSLSPFAVAVWGRRRCRSWRPSPSGEAIASAARGDRRRRRPRARGGGREPALKEIVHVPSQRRLRWIGCSEAKERGVEEHVLIYFLFIYLFWLR
uniref:Uncharacterized protein n=1 Tax=Oryza brachyantha TaxID=4533 RepID=J3L3N3_ORYBR